MTDSERRFSLDPIKVDPTLKNRIFSADGDEQVGEWNGEDINDLIKIKILGTLNGAIHATINSPDLGVLFTKCRKCGSEVKPLRDIIKCIECGWTDDRKLSNDFLNSDFIKMRE